jgi:hypothetical protein
MIKNRRKKNTLTESHTPPSENTKSRVIRVALLGAILGAILVHLLLILSVSTFGAVFGAGDVWNAGRPAENGTVGLQRAFGNLLTIYVMTAGLVPLVLSVVGAGLGVVVGLLVYAWRQRKKSR